MVKHVCTSFHMDRRLMRALETNATELAALDTSGDATVTALDDPFSPFC